MSDRIVKIDLDERTIARRSPDIERERAVAIYDLLEANRFALIDRGGGGPYHLKLSIEQNRLLLDVRSTADEPMIVFGLSLSPFRKVVKDYWEICESYYEAIKVANPSRIEALDMGRRATHNEGSDLLQGRLSGKVDLDQETSRRLFTLICVLHLR
ncbi:MAG: UPF0262 family protein [Alphaproteobacteria bacterium]|nr:UPF0262 family protein [Alphaproteobacteria bacterium]